MPWPLRRASPEDAGAAALVAGSTFLETYAGLLPGPDMVAHCARYSSPADFARWIGDPGAVLTLAEHPDGGAPVGYTLLTPCDLPVPLGEGDIELRRIYTLSLTRGTGLGAALMARAIADARALGARRLLLGMLGLNMRARDFYLRQGFAVVGRRDYRVGTTICDDLVLARAI